MRFFMIFPDLTVLRYDTASGTLASSESPQVAQTAIVNAQLVSYTLTSTDAAVIVTSELERTVFSATAGTMANNRMRQSASLFGAPRPGIKHPLVSRNIVRSSPVLAAVEWVFKNRGITKWKVDGLGHGVRRVYPSNGAIHSLRASVVMVGSDAEFQYDSYRLEWRSRPYLPHSLWRTTVSIDAELDRFSERYTDVKSFGALYIEVGHCLAALLYALRTSNIFVSAVHVCAEPTYPDEPLVVTLASVEIVFG